MERARGAIFDLSLLVILTSKKEIIEIHIELKYLLEDLLRCFIGFKRSQLWSVRAIESLVFMNSSSFLKHEPFPHLSILERYEV